MDTNYLRELGLCWAARGQPERGNDCIEAAATVAFHNAAGITRIERVLEYARHHGYTWDAIQATSFLGPACLALGEHQRAREALREAVRRGRATDSRLSVENCQRLLDELEERSR